MTPVAIRHTLFALAAVALAFASAGSPVSAQSNRDGVLGGHMDLMGTSQASTHSVGRKATQNGCYDNDPNTPCSNPVITDPAPQPKGLTTQKPARKPDLGGCLQTTSSGECVKWQ
jgi:hypothetical protein